MPSLAQFKAMVAAHEVHYFIAANGNTFGGGSGTSAQITAWVAAHFSKQTVAGVTVYNLARPGTSYPSPSPAGAAAPIPPGGTAAVLLGRQAPGAAGYSPGAARTKAAGVIP